MKTIPITDVLVPENRQRKDFDVAAIKELSDSILSDVGLLQPIVLRSDGKTLVAGERRLRAFQSIGDAGVRHDGAPVPTGHIPYVTIDELSEEALHEAELVENTLRVDLSWQERCKAIAALHHFRVEQVGNYDRSTGKGQSLKDTATEIKGREAAGSQIQEVADALLLEEFLDDPLVAFAKDVKTAKKAIREELANRERQQRAAEFDSSASSHHIYLESSESFALPEGLFDVIVTDPPYGIDADKKDTFDLDSHEYDDSLERFKQICDWLPEASFRAAAKQAHIYVFCDIRRFESLFTAFELSGWDVWPRPLIWDKGNTGSFGNIDYGFRACYEAILFANKGKRKVTAGFRDVININQTTANKHPAGKPIELYTELLKRSALPNDRVADFYAGSGPIFHAAHAHKCIAYGWEINPKYHAMAVERLKELK